MLDSCPVCLAIIFYVFRGLDKASFVAEGAMQSLESFSLLTFKGLWILTPADFQSCQKERS